jgi:hypothetical protein
MKWLSGFWRKLSGVKFRRMSRFGKPLIFGLASILLILFLGQQGQVNKIRDGDLQNNNNTGQASQPALSGADLDRLPFVTGVYESAMPDEAGIKRLDEIARLNLDLIINYDLNCGSVNQITSYLDAAAARKIKVIFPLQDIYYGKTGWPFCFENQPWYNKSLDNQALEEALVQGYIKQFGSHPALWGWYIDDEEPLIMIDRLRQRQALVKQLDPLHPTLAVKDDPEKFAAFRNTADLFGTDSYPVPYNPVSQVADWVDTARDNLGPNNITVIQTFSWEWAKEPWQPYPGSYPSYNQIRSMAYLGVNHGSRGLLFYSFFEIKRNGSAAEQQQRLEALGTLTAELRKLEQEGVFKVSPQRPGGVTASSLGETLDYAVWDTGKVVYLIAVNLNRYNPPVKVSYQGQVWTYLPQDVTFQLSFVPSRIEVSGENRTFNAHFTFTDHFEPNEVHIYKIIK